MNTPAKFNKIIDDLGRCFPKYPQNPLIIVSINEQKLYLIEENKVTESYIISSSKKGTGNLSGSYKTPLGVHCISEKLGNGAELGSIFKARENTYKIAKILTLQNKESNADNITSRILWLTGVEDGVNKGGNIDSHERYIYIHGTDEEGRLGKAVSHGCIRMSNQEIIELFDHVTVRTLVYIIE
jgi:lipoprotein-anchoring transpeptidase ErfK/SrfK